MTMATRRATKRRRAKATTTPHSAKTAPEFLIEGQPVLALVLGLKLLASELDGPAVAEPWSPEANGERRPQDPNPVDAWRQESDRRLLIFSIESGLSQVERSIAAAEQWVADAGPTINRLAGGGQAVYEGPALRRVLLMDRAYESARGRLPVEKMRIRAPTMIHMALELGRHVMKVRTRVSRAVTANLGEARSILLAVLGYFDIREIEARARAEIAAWTRVDVLRSDGRRDSGSDTHRWLTPQETRQILSGALGRSSMSPQHLSYYYQFLKTKGMRKERLIEATSVEALRRKLVAKTEIADLRTDADAVESDEAVAAKFKQAERRR